MDLRGGPWLESVRIRPPYCIPVALATAIPFPPPSPERGGGELGLRLPPTHAQKRTASVCSRMRSETSRLRLVAKQPFSLSLSPLNLNTVSYLSALASLAGLTLPSSPENVAT